MIKYFEQLKNIRVFSNLSDAELELVISKIKVRHATVEKDTTLFETDDVMQEFMVLISGRLQGSRYHYDGDVDLIQIFSLREIIGLDVVCSATRKSPLTLSSLEDSSLIFIDYDSLSSPALPEELRNTLQDNVIKVLASESIRRLHKIDVLYRKSLRSRIMVFLRHMQTMTQSDDFHIFMDREQFAQYLGVNRSSLSHELAKMREEGIIDFHKGHFIMKDETLL